MIRGEVNAFHEATVRLRVGGMIADEDVVFVIDSGFSDYLMLSPERIASLGMPFHGTAEYTLGDGSPKTFRVYIGQVDWDGEEREVYVLAGDGGDLLGTEMLYGSLITMDMRDGGVVTIQPSED